jgi:hypothetical protein
MRGLQRDPVPSSLREAAALVQLHGRLQSAQQRPRACRRRPRLSMADEWGPNALSCMPNRTKCRLSALSLEPPGSATCSDGDRRMDSLACQEVGVRLAGRAERVCKVDEAQRHVGVGRRARGALVHDEHRRRVEHVVALRLEPGEQVAQLRDRAARAAVHARRRQLRLCARRAPSQSGYLRTASGSLSIYHRPVCLPLSSTGLPACLPAIDTGRACLPLLPVCLCATNTSRACLPLLPRLEESGTHRGGEGQERLQ